MGIYDRLASICYENVVVASNLPKIEANIHLHDFSECLALISGLRLKMKVCEKWRKLAGKTTLNGSSSGSVMGSVWNLRID